MSLTMKPTDEQIRALRDFHRNKTMSSYCEYKALLPALQEHFPEVMAAITAVKVAERTLDAVVEQMYQSTEDDHVSGA